MIQLTKLNLIIGFSSIILAACGGAFVANELTQNFVLKLLDQNQSWYLTMLKSAHGHTNLFGILHVLLGLTQPHSSSSLRVKRLQTLFLFLGTLAMGLGLLLQGFTPATDSINILSIIIGTCLGLSLVSLVSHLYGIMMKTKNLG